VGSACVLEGLDITQNIGAWSKVANVLYLDSPSGVGLSYSSEAQDYVTNDTATARDGNVFLRKFFDLYPDFVSHDFYISGMSLINPPSHTHYLSASCLHCRFLLDAECICALPCRPSGHSNHQIV
jgi:hypothetical protein